MRVRVIPYNRASNSAKLLSRAIGAKRIRLEGSRFRPSSSDVMINWGNSGFNHNQYGNPYYLLNHPVAVGFACDKRKTIIFLKRAGVPTVQATLVKVTAQQWLLEGSQVYSRTLLNSHSGKGIVLNKPSENGPEELVEGKLYTKAITGKRREFRIHVFRDKVIHCQTKKRKNGWRDNPNYCDEIRNKHTGWIYSLDTEHVTEEMKEIAVKAIAALGLDFGGVDIIQQGDKCYVLEVNTACGLSNPSTLEVYSKVFKEYISNI